MAAGGMIVIGQSRSGKTTAIDIVHERLSHEGFHVVRFDDKDYLMNEAIADMGDRDLYHGPLETDKTRVLNPEVARTEPRRLQLVFKDGRLLNDAHIKIMRDIGNALSDGDGRTIVLADLAYGKDVTFGDGKEVLLQSGMQFVKWFREYGLLNRHNVFIREITAPFQVRAERNEHSRERIETEEFRLLFPDIGIDGRGFFMPERIILGGKLKHIDNGKITLDTYLHTIHEDYDQNFRPRLNGEDREAKMPLQSRR